MRWLWPCLAAILLLSASASSAETLTPPPTSGALAGLVAATPVPPGGSSGSSPSFVPGVASGAPEAPAFTGEVIRDLTYSGPRGLAMPTAVAVSSRGRVYVADGVNDRVVVFEPSGEFAGEITTAAGRRLSRPMSVKIDAQDRLWIADTGNGRAVCRSLATSAEQVVPTGADSIAKGGLDLTDMAVAPDGLMIWLVGNDNQRLIRAEVATGRTRQVGGEGEAPGQFNYPFMIALAADGGPLVTDVINGRIVSFDTAGNPVSTIGTYGLEPGSLYRPSGIALDTAGRVWVSDCVLGGVQVFSQRGEFLGVLSTAGGAPLTVEMPMGITFGPDGDLYVAELAANRVRRVRLTVGPGAAGPVLQSPLGTPALAPRPSQGTVAPVPQPPSSIAYPVLSSPPDTASLTAQASPGNSGTPQPRTCTACHLDWLPPLAEGRGTVFVPASVFPPDNPRVSQSPVCLTCHNGTVADRRREIWYEHSHRTGFPPPADVQVPSSLPLPGGKLECRTCHSAHTLAGPTTMKTAITLRAEHEASELCESCHPGLRSGKEHGMHPLGDMKIPVPENLLYPGSPASGQKVACLVCHRAHGAREKILLAVSGGTNELCASCHAGLAPGLFGERERGKHARQPVLKAGQRQFAAGLRTRVGPSGELLCMTCHPAHKAASGRYLLAFDTAQPSSCSGCHSAQGLTVNSTHDLRAAHADARNVLGMTAREGGPCSGCHTAHRYGRAAAPGPLDPKGVCLTCHRAGEIAAATRLGAVNHPEKPCQDCHNPHEPGKGKYLRSSIRDLCLSCHKPMAGMQGGPHDVEQKPTAWPADAVASRDPCLACHRMHGNEQTGLYRMGFAPQAAKPDAACVACHADTAPNIGGDHALVHPGPVIKVTARADFPLAKSQTGSPLIACKTCHDPHRAPAAGDEAAVLLRAEPSESGRTMCLACHPQTAGIGSTGHSPDLLRQAGFATTACQPCHLAHAKPEAVEARVLYPSALLLEAKTSPLNLAADRFCVACHRPGGPVAPPTIATHKVVPMFNPTKPDQPGFLPLFNAEGETDPSGGISCRTCHVTHGRGEPAPLPEQVAGELTARESRARHYRLRSFGQSSVCNTCHGPDALWRFLYFHDPARRNPAPAQGSPGAFAPGGPVPRAP